MVCAGAPNANRLGQMTRIGRADEGDCDCWLGKTERQSGRSCRSACPEIRGEDLAGDNDSAAFAGALQVNAQVLTVWTKWRLNHFNAPIGSDTGQGRLIVA
jgi:hypothetical protein